MENIRENKMGTVPVFKLIVSMSIPAMFSMLIQALYNIVDSMFVAQIGEEALTALSLAFPIQALIIALAVGTSVGINSLVARKLGEGNLQEANSAATHGVLLAFLSWILVAVLGAIFIRPFFEAFSNNPTVIQYGCDYLYIVTIFSFGIFIEIALEKTLQGTGNMVYPMLFQLTGAISNIILDPIMIFGLLGFPALGVKGAAIATVIGQILAMLFATYVIFCKNHVIHITFKKFRLRLKTIADIYAVALPTIIMQSIASVLVSGLNAILIGFSETAVSVLGIYYRLQSFVFMPVFGLTQGVMPILGYNYGARNKKRMMDALKYGCGIAAAIMSVGMLCFMLFPKQLLGIFNASQHMLQIGTLALRIISTCFIAAAFGILFSTLFQAVGNGVYSLIISVLRQLVVILPAAYLLSKLGLEFVWYAFPIAEVVSLIVSIILFSRLYQRELKYLEHEKTAQ